MIGIFVKKEKLEQFGIKHLDENIRERIWIDIQEEDKVQVKEILEKFKIHPLTIEDAQGTNARLKLENYTDHPDCNDYLFIVFKKISFDRTVKSNQISLILGKNFLITICPKKIDTIDPIKKNLQLIDKRLGKGPDYMVHWILDTLVDEQYPLMDKLYERLDKLEEKIFKQTASNLLNELFLRKRDILTLRKIIQPERDAIVSLAHGPSKFISKSAGLYFRDINDHLFHNLERLDSFRELISSALEVQLSMTSNRMNDIMKVLTIISTIMLPLTLVTGIYGMNFNPKVSILNMPELNWVFGYPFALLLMLSISIIFIVYFKKKGWI